MVRIEYSKALLTMGGANEFATMKVKPKAPIFHVPFQLQNAICDGIIASQDDTRQVRLVGIFISKIEI